MNLKHNRIIRNTAMLFLMNIAKIVLPLLTMPYLTRVLSTPGYGFYTYVRSVMTYMQLIVDFGFLLSATKDIAKSREDLQKVGEITGHVLVGKLFLALSALGVLCVMMLSIGRLRQHPLYTLLSFVQVVTTIFLADFLFHGLEQMQVITIRYFITRTITVALTFLLIHNDSDLILIPILEIVGNLVAIIWVWKEIHRLQIKVRFRSLKTSWAMLRDSFVYFLSDIASTAFGALNTLLVGIMLTDQDLAFWGVAMTFVSAVQMMYNPICNSIYPHMVREKSLRVIRNVLLVFIPVIVVGCVIVWFGADLLVWIMGGVDYLGAAPLLRWLVPLLFISFFPALFGWPVLGPIGKTRETTMTTIIAAAVQVLGLVALMLLDRFTLFNLCMLRAATDLLLSAMRIGYFWRYRKEFH